MEWPLQVQFLKFEEENNGITLLQSYIYGLYVAFFSRLHTITYRQLEDDVHFWTLRKKLSCTMCALPFSRRSSVTNIWLTAVHIFAVFFLGWIWFLCFACLHIVANSTLALKSTQLTIRTIIILKSGNCFLVLKQVSYSCTLPFFLRSSCALDTTWRPPHDVFICSLTYNAPLYLERHNSLEICISSC